MDIEIVEKLNELDRRFYQEVGGSFDETRKYYWKGWEVLYEKGHLTSRGEVLKVLDLGCGNGRFAKFIHSKGIHFDYFGVDNSMTLLKSAEDQLSSLLQNSIELRVTDILDIVGLEKLLEGKRFDLIVLFGVMHHIPGIDKRIHILKLCKRHLMPGGKLIFSVWDFMNEERYQKRLIDPEMIDLTTDDLEEGDHILDWRRDKVSYRYCHYYSEDEINALIERVGMVKIDQFTSDGQSGKLNRYYVVKEE